MMHFLVGAVPCLVAWAGLRRGVGARFAGPGLLLDLLPVVVGFAALLAATGRPILSAVPIVAAAAGLALADRVKRAVLREPLVFADRAELLEVVRHPRLYLPFAGTGLVLGGAGAALAGLMLLAWVEPPLFPASFLAALGAMLVCVGAFVVPTWPPLLRQLNRVYATWPITRDPARDAALFGLLATLVIHATLARAERPARRQVAQAAGPVGAVPHGAGPLIVVQLESFFDPGHVHPDLADRLPALAALRRGAARYGRLDVPCWGANTVRTEFTVLTGLPPAMTGLDVFNPYADFARVRLPSLAQKAQDAGYRTICVHPYDIGFYARNKVLPLLGFDELIGIDAFGTAPRDGVYVADTAVARVVADIVRQRGPRVMVLAITMENHGPWDGVSDPLPPAVLPPALAHLPEAAQLGRWLRHAANSDSMIPILTDALRDTPGGGWLALYGDHQPGLVATFDALGLQDTRTDYVVWASQEHPDGQGAAQRDLPAHALADVLLAAMAGTSR